ncbi:MAG TPA: Stp1/IreP family PP2C-type Ser/Thr phosphatase [Anaerolineae bacterium]|nr:Stp1/IreP family PP2C-type Ser/Thr phosphatase [Anaerolineae bacterium]
MAQLGQIKACLRTDTGQVRGHNEDFIYSLEPQTPEEAEKNGWLYIIADGVGGADAGEVASQYATERMVLHYQNNVNSDWGERIVDAMQAANTDLRKLVADRNDNSRMATTMVTAVIRDNHAYIGNVGDSRAYHWRHGRLQQITKDQSLVAKLVEEGAITQAEADVHPRRNVILYSLGSENTPKIELFELDLAEGDLLLLCSDGLTRHLTDDEINTIISRATPEFATEQMIFLANERGGEDNISAGIIQIGERVIEETRPFTPPIQETAPFVIPTAATQTAVPSSHDRALLWLYTIALTLLMAVLIFIVWFILRV